MVLVCCGIVVKIGTTRQTRSSRIRETKVLKGVVVLLLLKAGKAVH